MSQMNQSGVEQSQQMNADLEREVAEALGGQTVEQVMEQAAAAPPPGGDPAAGEPGEAGEHAQPQRFEHDIKRGRIAAVRGDDVFVDLSGVEGKNQGVLPLTQFERPPRVGSIMDFVVESYEEAEGLWRLSREGAVSRATWEHLQRGAIVEARVVAHNKGGLELEMIGGIRAFMPASQIDLHHTANMEEYVGQKVHAVVQEIDRRSKKVIISRRQFLERERQQNREKLLNELQIGQTIDGAVTSLMEYGAFVDLGGTDGLIHVSDLSYKHVGKPAEVLKVGDKVRVKVLKIDKEKGRIGLGLKQVEPDPWEGLEERLKVGEEISARVLRLAEFGAFIEVQTGVEGLLPISEISWKRIAKASEVIKEGDVVRLKVISMDVPKRRLSLSLKQSIGDPWTGATVRFAKHSLVDATVMSITDFGAFCEIEAGVEGLVHISELSDKRVNAVGDVLKVGDKYPFRVLEVDEEHRRIRLSLKAVKEPVPAPAPPPEGPAGRTVAAQPIKGPAVVRKKPGNLRGGMDKSNALGMGLRDLKL